MSLVFLTQGIAVLAGVAGVSALANAVAKSVAAPPAPTPALPPAGALQGAGQTTSLPRQGEQAEGRPAA